MDYLIIFLEGIITFISPCMLPMIPIYISYFAGQKSDEQSIYKTLFNVLGFILGFTIIFALLGVFSASLGILLKANMNIINILLGIIVAIFGLNFMGVINLRIINKSRGIKLQNSKVKFFSSFIFGIVFSLTWTPCVGAFLGTALSVITVSGNILKGFTLILMYCLGLGIPFLLSAFLIDKLKNTFDNIKKHYRVINIICGVFLCIIGILMITGMIDKYFSFIV